MNRRTLLKTAAALPIAAAIPALPFDLQAAVDAMPNGAVLRVPAGEYWLSEPLRIVGKDNFRIIFDEGATIILREGVPHVVEIHRCQHWNIAGMNFWFEAPYRRQKATNSILEGIAA